MKDRAILATVIGLAIAGGWDPRNERFLLRLDKQSCSECGKKIPPGKAGRKCPECRSSKETLQ